MELIKLGVLKIGMKKAKKLSFHELEEKEEARRTDAEFADDDLSDAQFLKSKQDKYGITIWAKKVIAELIAARKLPRQRRKSQEEVKQAKLKFLKKENLSEAEDQCSTWENEGGHVFCRP
jgi:hypothetical protein